MFLFGATNSALTYPISTCCDERLGEKKILESGNEQLNDSSNGISGLRLMLDHHFLCEQRHFIWCRQWLFPFVRRLVKQITQTLHPTPCPIRNRIYDSGDGKIRQWISRGIRVIRVSPGSERGKRCGMTEVPSFPFEDGSRCPFHGQCPSPAG